MTDELPLTAQERALNDLPDEFLTNWRTLADNAVEPNPFLLPEFVLPQARFLPHDAPLSLWTVEHPTRGVLLLALLHPIAASSQIPFPHLSDKTWVYQFQGGMLLDRRLPRRTMLAFLEHLKITRFRHGMMLNSACVDSPFSEQLYTSAALSGFQVQLQGVWSRASLDLQELNHIDPFEACLSKNSRKSLRRAYGKLQLRGPVRFRAIEDREEIAGAVTRFLDLEKRGWKQESGTAIGCQPAHQAFFEAMADAMAARSRILFGELLVGDEVIASTCNLIAGGTLFAFKIGWNPELREGSPGTWAEIELARYLAAHRPEIGLINSCSAAGSYLDRLWPHRIAMGQIVLSQSHRAVLYRGFRKTLRTARHLLWPGTLFTARPQGE